MFNIKLIILTIFSTHIVYADMNHAKELFTDAKCLECHETNSFKHREKKVNNFKKLTSIVERCEYNNDVGWFDDERKDVVLYLNDLYYHYKTPKKQK